MCVCLLLLTGHSFEDQLLSTLFRASSLYTCYLFVLAATKPHKLTEDKLLDLNERKCIRENSRGLACNDKHDLLLPRILYKSKVGRYRPVRVADGPITARYRFIKN